MQIKINNLCRTRQLERVNILTQIKEIFYFLKFKISSHI